ncbi:MAG TPA: hypothetical protein VMY80_05435 [Anaerolineae bacterium]|nr:hypothetical protein [Anaerolineae bacterium]
MLKAGLIGAGVGFVLALVAVLVTPFCNPCVALLLGLGVGVLAAVWERPATSGGSAGEGAKAGAIAAVGGLLGQMVGAVANGLMVGPEKAAEMFRQLNIDVPAITQQTYWVYNVGGNCLCGAFSVALGAGLGALGGLLWYQVKGKNQPPASPYAGTL